jgi:hypothetical protein
MPPIDFVSSPIMQLMQRLEMQAFSPIQRARVPRFTLICATLLGASFSLKSCARNEATAPMVSPSFQMPSALDSGSGPSTDASGSASTDRKAQPAAKFNRAPNANPGPSRYVELGQSVVFDGSGSSDPDGDKLTYFWSMTSASPAAANVIKAPTAESFRWKPDRAGNYLLLLTVKDGHGGSDTQSAELVVRATGAPTPAPYAGPTQRVEVGSLVHLDGSRSYPSSATHLRYAWKLRSRPAGSDASLSTTTTANASFTADRSGTYLVELRVGTAQNESLPDVVQVIAEPTSREPANLNAPAEIIVTDQVLRTDVEPLGMNLTKITGGTNFTTNNFFYGTGFEPLLHRRLLRIDRAGSDAKGQWIEWNVDQGPHFYETLWTGFGNGANVRFYRLVDAKGGSLPFTRGIGDASGADHVVFLGNTQIPEKTPALPQGGWMPDGQNRVYVDHGLNLRQGDYAFLVLKRLAVPVEQLHPRVQKYYHGNFRTLWMDKGIEASLVRHPAPIPTDFEMRGETCLKLDIASSAPASVGQWIFHPYDTKEGQWYSQLHPGRTYRFSAWLRRAGTGNGQVRAGFGGNSAYAILNQRAPWFVTDKWQHYTYDFLAGPYPQSGSHIGPRLEFTGGGTYYVDNLMLYEFNPRQKEDPNGPNPLSLDTWMASVPASGAKPAVRFSSSYQTSSVDNLLGNQDGNPTYSVNDGVFKGSSGVTLPALMVWAYKTGTAPGNRVVPLLTFAEEYTEDEWAAIVEYLGVPFEEGVDSQKSKPYAYMRFRQRGHGRPWTEDFREIILEYGNETWHNGAGGYGWDGFGAPNAVHQGGVEYGLFARYMFEEHVMKRPFWGKYNLGDKLKFALGANYSATADGGGSYGEAAVMHNHITDYLGHANYVGPKWETNDKGKSTFDAHGLQATLLGMEAMRNLIADSDEVRRKINGTLGRQYRLEAYEGGPSGYWTNKGEAAEIDELYGKSLAMGVAALDAWLFSSLHGFSHQCYLGFSSGIGWSSHTMPEAGGFRAHPGWLALKMRNVFARGREMLGVDFVHVPSIEHQEGKKVERLPLVSAYAFKDSSSVSVVVLSRKYPGKHDGADFGSGYTPVAIRVPSLATPRRIILYKLAHRDGSPATPAENNRQDERIVINSSEIPISAYHNGLQINEETGGGREGMPPGTVYLYTFEQ